MRTNFPDSAFGLQHKLSEKANEDLPDPLGPVKTTSLPFGISASTFCKLFSEAPRTSIKDEVIRDFWIKHYTQDASSKKSLGK